MTTSKTITGAIAYSASRDEIAHVDLTDLLRLLAAEAHDDGDTAEMCAACIAEIEGSDDDDSDDGVPQAERIRTLCRRLIDTAQMDHTDVDDVENGGRWEMWGTTKDGDEYRVHIRLDF